MNSLSNLEAVQLVEDITNNLFERGYRQAPATKSALAEGRYNALTFQLGYSLRVLSIVHIDTSNGLSKDSNVQFSTYSARGALTSSAEQSVGELLRNQVAWPILRPVGVTVATFPEPQP